LLKGSCSNLVINESNKMEETPVHIFVVENSNIFTNMLEYVFTKDIKYRFLDFKSGEECINNLDLEPDIIVMNYSLPGMSGADALREVKKRMPQACVLMMVSDRDAGNASGLLKIGADDCILMETEGMEKMIEKLEAHLAITELKRPLGFRKKKKPSLEKLHYTD
jgi:DNA-binding NarL/FixJ family response regulator